MRSKSNHFLCVWSSNELSKQVFVAQSSGRATSQHPNCSISAIHTMGHCSFFMHHSTKHQKYIKAFLFLFGIFSFRACVLPSSWQTFSRDNASRSSINLTRWKRLNFFVFFFPLTQKGAVGFAEKLKANSLQTWFTLEVGAGTRLAIFGTTRILRNSSITFVRGALSGLIMYIKLWNNAAIVNEKGQGPFDWFAGKRKIEAEVQFSQLLRANQYFMGDGLRNAMQFCPQMHEV